MMNHSVRKCHLLILFFELVPPPAWDNNGVKPDHETPYANENMWSRPPVGISLRKGWNSLVIKLPVGSFSTTETRLVKWMFTAMLAGIGCSAVTGNNGGLKLLQGWSDNMVLQRDRIITLKGHSDREEPVEVSLAGKTYHDVASAESIKEFSAMAYYFGMKLRDELGIPVGLIQMAVGGSPAEAWIERKALEMHPQLVGLLYDYRKSEFREPWVSNSITATLKNTDNPRQRHPFEPAYLFESGISQIAGLNIQT